MNLKILILIVTSLIIKPQQVMLSVRELDINQISQQAQTWVNKHLIFTHGYGSMHGPC